MIEVLTLPDGTMHLRGTAKSAECDLGNSGKFHIRRPRQRSSHPSFRRSYSLSFEAVVAICPALLLLLPRAILPPFRLAGLAVVCVVHRQVRYSVIETKQKIGQNLSVKYIHKLNIF